MPRYEVRLTPSKLGGQRVEVVEADRVTFDCQMGGMLLFERLLDGSHTVTARVARVYAPGTWERVIRLDEVAAAN